MLYNVLSKQQRYLLSTLGSWEVLHTILFFFLIYKMSQTFDVGFDVVDVEKAENLKYCVRIMCAL